MNNSELSEFWNKVLVYYRDIRAYQEPFTAFENIFGSDFRDYALMDLTIDKLVKKEYLLKPPYDSYEQGYCISGDGIIFINAGGYMMTAEVKTETAQPINYNPYPQIFVNYNGFKLFDKLHNEFKGSKKLLADYSFIYRMMYADDYIFQNFKPEMFIKWLAEEPNSIYLDLKLKTLNNCTTPNKVSIYKALKENVPLGI